MNHRQQWERVNFGDVVRNVRETEHKPLENGLERYVGLGDIEPEDLHIRSWGMIEDGTSFTRLFREGQVLFARRRAYQRKVAVAEWDGLCSGDLMVFEPKPNRNGDVRLLPELLPFIVQSEPFFQYVLDMSQGSLSPRVKWKDLAQYEFALPPLEEQRRIADILWAADTNVQTAMSLEEQLTVLRQAVMRDLFDPNYNRNQGHKVELRQLSEVLSHASDGPFGSKLKTAHYSDEGARVIRLQNIDEGFFDSADEAFIPMDYYNNSLSRYAVDAGDIIVAGLGDDTYPVGRACQVPSDLGPAVHKADCFCLKADLSYVTQQYLAYFLNSPFARLEVSKVAQGTTRLRVNVTNLKTIRIPVPSLHRQREVCDIISQIKQAYIDAQATTGVKRELFFASLNHLLNRESNV